jgi:hypothetical protein
MKGKIETIFLIDETKQLIYLEKIMKFPPEIETIIKEYAQPRAATLREDWRKGSSINAILTRDQWWEDYIFGWGCMHQDESWLEWCKYKMIIGPPRQRSNIEEAELDEDYLTQEDIIRHCRPWSRTWPHPDDHSWCSGPYRTSLPCWAKNEYIERVSNHKNFKVFGLFRYKGIGHSNLNKKCLEFI